MGKIGISEAIKKLSFFNCDGMYLSDFLLTWEKTDDELVAVFAVAEILRGLRRNNISARVFDSGLVVNIFRDHSTRTRFSFASASNWLGLTPQDLDEGKSQIAHGETVRETANMVSFMADVIGIRDDMREAFRGADIVYPMSWAPYAAMEKRTDLYGRNDMAGIKELEKELLAQNAKHKDGECTETLMKETRQGRALYMHCLPAGISGVSCKEGEVAASVFDRYRDPLYREASYKPYVIAAMIFLSKVKRPADRLMGLLEAGRPRVS